MIKKIEDLNFYELLEISPGATPQEVHKAYDRVRRIYEPNSIALYSLFTSEETTKIRQRIEEAYRTLSYDDNRRRYDRTLKESHEFPEPERRSPAPGAKTRRPVQLNLIPEHVEEEEIIPVEPLDEPEPSIPASVCEEPKQKTEPPKVEVAEFTGLAIRVLREQAGLTIRNVADATKINSRYLEYIEHEDFSRLPPRTYLRGFLLQYARMLGVDPEQMTSDFVKRCDQAAAQKSK